MTTVTQKMRDLGYEPLMTPAEVAAVLRVHAKTVTRWAARGLLPCVWTPGGPSHGHRRYRVSDVRALTAASRERTP